MLEAINHLTNTQRSIVSGSEKPYRVEILLRVISSSSEERAPQESKREHSVLKGLLQGNGFLAQSASADNIRYLARKCFAIPTTSREEDDRITLSNYLANIFPYGCSTFLSSELCENGVWVGWVQPSNQPFFLDFDAQLSQGMFVIGHLGSGKTVYGRTAAIRSHLQGRGILVISPTDEYVAYASKHGAVLTFGYDEQDPDAIALNILGIYGIPLPERKRQIRELLAHMFNLTDFSQILLGEALNEVYQSKGISNSLRLL